MWSLVVDYPKPAPTLTRAKATHLLNLVIERARLVNSLPDEYPYRVKSLVVFGSYLGNKPLLGDLDIGVGVAMVRQPEFYGKHQRHIHWANKTLVALRLRKPKVISVHYREEVEGMGAPYQEVFRA